MTDERAMWLGAAIAVVASLLLTTVAAALESSINGPGKREVAAPVLWAFGGGAGLLSGAVVASWLSRRAWPGIFAAVVGALPFLVLVVLGYNSSDLEPRTRSWVRCSSWCCRACSWRWSSPG